MDEEDTVRAGSHADTEEWLEKEELKNYLDDARRMQEYWDEQDREREELQAAQAAQRWDDWALASEMERPGDNKRRRLTIMVNSEGSATGQTVHHVPLPSEGWAHVAFLIPPGMTPGEPLAPAGGGVPVGSLSNHVEGQPAQVLSVEDSLEQPGRDGGSQGVTSNKPESGDE